MTRRIRPALEMLAMVAISALLYVEFFYLNDLAFSQFEHIQGVNWIFVPAGFRVLLVLGMGLPGAVGILLGNCWLDRDHLSDDTAIVLLTALASGFTPWCVKLVMEKKQILTRQLQKLTAQHLLQFVLTYAAANALTHQLVWWTMKRPGVNPWVDFWPMFVGDAIGAMLVLYTIKLMLPALLGWAAPLRTRSQAKTRPASR